MKKGEKPLYALVFHPGSCITNQAFSTPQPPPYSTPWPASQTLPTDPIPTYVWPRLSNLADKNYKKPLFYPKYYKKRSGSQFFTLNSRFLLRVRTYLPRARTFLHQARGYFARTRYFLRRARGFLPRARTFLPRTRGFLLRVRRYLARVRSLSLRTRRYFPRVRTFLPRVYIYLL
jgi:hypothetical protein